MQNLKDKINHRMDILQDWMEQDYHMKKPEVVYDHTLTISKFWSVLSPRSLPPLDGYLDTGY